MAASKIWTQTFDQDLEKSGPWKNLDPKNPGPWKNLDP